MRYELNPILTILILNFDLRLGSEKLRSISYDISITNFSINSKCMFPLKKLYGGRTLSVAIYHTSIVFAINALLMKNPFFIARRASSSRYIIIKMSLKKNHMHN